jgi:hypothetical protein
MVKKYAIIENGKVTNAVVWDGVTPWEGSENAVEITGTAGIGWDYSNGIFTDNRPKTESED